MFSPTGTNLQEAEIRGRAFVVIVVGGELIPSVPSRPLPRGRRFTIGLAYAARAWRLTCRRR